MFSKLNYRVCIPINTGQALNINYFLHSENCRQLWDDESRSIQQYVRHGGHNPLEPAHFGCKIISGKNMFLQRELFKYVSHVQFVELDEIADALRNAETLPPSSVNAMIDLDRVMECLH